MDDNSGELEGLPIASHAEHSMIHDEDDAPIPDIVTPSETTALASQETQPDPTMAEPPFASFVAVLSYSVWTVTVFTICIPTSAAYVMSLGASASFAGWMVGITPIFSGVVQPAIAPLVARVALKKILVVFCGVNIIGAIIYALGTQSNWLGTILFARAIQGAVGGPTYASTYVARTTGIKKRSLYMQYVGIGIGLGYGLGPILGSLVDVVCRHAGLEGQIVNSYTAPNWLMAIVFAVEALVISYFMIEPPSGKPPVVANAPGGAGGDKPPPPQVPWSRVCAAYFVVFCTPVNVGPAREDLKPRAPTC